MGVAGSWGEREANPWLQFKLQLTGRASSIGGSPSKAHSQFSKVTYGGFGLGPDSTTNNMLPQLGPCPFLPEHARVPVFKGKFVRLEQQGSKWFPLRYISDIEGQGWGKWGDRGRQKVPGYWVCLVPKQAGPGLERSRTEPTPFILVEDSTGLNPKLVPCEWWLCCTM